jgi:AraC family transcriptional regulator of adaptative response / DNA-3-methyladenine glycosylase II
VPGAWGYFETAIHAIVAQHCGLARARTRMGELVRDFGQPVPGLTGGLSHLFPSAAVLAAADLDFPRTTAATIQAFSTAVAAGDVVLDNSLGLAEFVSSLTRIRGISVSCAHQVALRLGQPDAFPVSDPSASGSWQPWRALAATHLLAYASG